MAACVENNPVPVADLPDLIASVSEAIGKLRGASQTEQRKLKPAVDPKKSAHSKHVVCLEDGKKFTSLKRHLRDRHGMTPEEYRTKWGLPLDYPMNSPAYSAVRSTLASAWAFGRNLSQGDRILAQGDAKLTAYALRSGGCPGLLMKRPTSVECVRGRRPAQPGAHLPPAFAGTAPAPKKREKTRLVPCSHAAPVSPACEGDAMPVFHARGAELVVELPDAAEHLDRIPTAELKALLEETAMVLGVLLKRDIIPSGETPVS